MSKRDAFEKCLAFVNCHVQPSHGYRRLLPEGTPRMAVTISRQTGSGAREVAAKLAAYLEAQGPRGVCPWTVFDRNLMEQVLEDHHLPKRIAEFLPEDRTSVIKDGIEELLGLHPSASTVIYQTAETILHLIELGHVILIGRAASVIAGRVPEAVHARLVASWETRLARVVERRQLNARQAADFIKREDAGRARYLQRYYRRCIDDPLLYDLVINTDRVGFDEAARLIGDAVLDRSAVLSRGR